MSLTKLSILFYLLFFGIGLSAQENKKDESVVIESNSTDTVRGQVADSILLKKHSPKKAAILSAVLPGAGQVYNKKYWKLPIVYGLGAGLIYLVSLNYGEYQKYRQSYISRVDSTSGYTDLFPTVSSAGLQTEIERYQKNYELAAVGVALVYVLQIVDATVDAHLKNFDVSDDLSLSIRPTFHTSPYQFSRGVSPSFGLKLKLHIK